MFIYLNFISILYLLFVYGVLYCEDAVEYIGRLPGQLKIVDPKTSEMV